MPNFHNIIFMNGLPKSFSTWLCACEKLMGVHCTASSEGYVCAYL